MTSPPPPIRITVLISGSGTNLQAVIDAISSNKLPSASIIRVISNRKSAYGLTRASNASIPTTYHNLLAYKKRHPATEDGVAAARREYDAELARLVLEEEDTEGGGEGGLRPDLVLCLGFMHVLSVEFLEPVERKGVRIVNLHPALPGQFNGAQAIERAHEAWIQGKIDKTGVMIHKVISEVDMGTPILVKEVPFVKGEDEDLDVLEKKIHEVEWKAVIEGTLIVLNEIREEKRKKDADAYQ